MTPSAADWSAEPAQVYARALHAAAPLIVAAALDKRADAMEVEAQRLIDSVTDANVAGLGAAGAHAALTRQAREMRADATSLRSQSTDPEEVRDGRK